MNYYILQHSHWALDAGRTIALVHFEENYVRTKMFKTQSNLVFYRMQQHTH